MKRLFAIISMVMVAIAASVQISAKDVTASEKVLKKVLKFFERKIWRFQINLLTLQPLSLKMTAIAKGFSKKIFQNIFEKDLADSKIVLTFAPLSALKNRKPKIRILDYGLKIKLRSLRILSS